MAKYIKIDIVRLYLLSLKVVVNMLEIEQNYFPIGTVIEWHSIPYGIVKGIIKSAPYYDGMLKYNIDSFNNNEYDGKIYYVPHEMYRLTFRIQ